MAKLLATNLETSQFLSVEVDDSLVSEAKRNKDILSDALDLEVLYDQIVETYWDYKNKINYWHMRAVFRGDRGYLLGHEIRSSLNRLVFNLLNLSKLYLDQHYHEDKDKCFAYALTLNEDFKNQVIAQRKQLFDENAEYQIGCKLRNYCQHGKLPVSQYTVSLRRAYPEGGKKVHFVIEYDEQFLKSIKVAGSLVSTQSKWDLSKILDGYVYALGQMHDLNRQLTNASIENAKNFFKTLTKRYLGKDFANNLVCRLEAPDYQEQIDIEWFDLHSCLMAKHRTAVNFADFEFCDIDQNKR